MRANLISLAAGTLCLPATYRLTRYGIYEWSIVAIVAIAMLSTWLALRYVDSDDGRVGWWTLASAFGGGAMLSEALYFAYYYFDYGHADAKLSVGITISIIEGGLIALLGATIVTVAFFAFRRITKALRTTR